MKKLYNFNGDLNGFYKTLRWKNWRSDVQTIDGSKVFNQYPPLWTKEGKDIEKVKRSVITINELYQYILSVQILSVQKELFK